MNLHTAITPFGRIIFADAKEALGNALRENSPRSQFNEAFVNCLMHDTRVAHALLPLIQEALHYEDKAFEEDCNINAADLLEWFAEWRLRAEKILRGEP